MEKRVITLRRSEDRGRGFYGWLDTRHTFSFGSYYDPAHMGFRSLRVINDDRVAPGAGFPRHPHRDMEILTYVLDGALEHRDSLGNGSVIRPGEIQRMSAGTGILHSEFNHSKEDPLRFLQIWIEPNRLGISPSYQQETLASRDRRGPLRLIASPDNTEGTVLLHQDARVYAGLLEDGQELEHRLGADRHTWIHVARGTARVGEHELREGDGAALHGSPTIELTGVQDAELLLFDLA
jgi:redox-sensitive bicupin YhaK (pirin superfamily)